MGLFDFTFGNEEEKQKEEKLSPDGLVRIKPGKVIIEPTPMPIVGGFSCSMYMPTEQQPTSTSGGYISDLTPIYYMSMTI